MTEEAAQISYVYMTFFIFQSWIVEFWSQGAKHQFVLPMQRKHSSIKLS